MRGSRVVLLTITGSVVLGLGPSGIALAEHTSAAVRQERGAGLDRESTVAAGYTARDRAHGQTWLSGTITVPTLGECSDGDVGAFTGIELARARGGVRYATGGVYSMCVDGVPTHTPVFETTTEGRVLIDEVVEDGDQIDVFLPRIAGDIRIQFENLTQDWSLWKTFDGFRPSDASALYRSIAVDGVPLAVLDPGGAEVTDLLVNGRPLELTDPKKWVLVDDAGDPQVRPTKIKDQTDFGFRRVG